MESKSGYLLIGHAVTDTTLHAPAAPNTERVWDLEAREWDYIAANERECVIRATSLPKHAIMRANFGSNGERDQLLGPNGPLTNAPPPHYGWDSTGNITYAIPEIIFEARLRGIALRGAISVVKRDNSFWPLTFESGEFISPKSHRTLVHFPVTGLDLPSDIQYANYGEFRGPQAAADPVNHANDLGPGHDQEL